MTEITYNGITGKCYKHHNKYVIFEILGRHNITKKHYACEVEGSINNESIIVENVDCNGYEYDNLIRTMIKEMSKPHFVSFE